MLVLEIAFNTRSKRNFFAMDIICLNLQTSEGFFNPNNNNNNNNNNYIMITIKIIITIMIIKMAIYCPQGSVTLRQQYTLLYSGIFWHTLANSCIF